MKMICAYLVGRLGKHFAQGITTDAGEIATRRSQKQRGISVEVKHVMTPTSSQTAAPRSRADGKLSGQPKFSPVEGGTV